MDLRFKEMEFFFDNLNEGAVVFNEKRKVVLVNKVAVKLYGYSSKESFVKDKIPKIRSYFLDTGKFIPYDRWPSAQVLKGESISNSEIRIENKLDGRKWIESYSGKLIRTRKQKFIIATVRDITLEYTQRKIAQLQLQAQREVFETTIKKLPAGIGVYSGSNFVIEIANPVYLAIAQGRTVLGQPYKKVWPEAYPLTEPLLRRVLNTGKSHRAVDQKFLLRNSKGKLEERYFTWSLIRIPLPGEKNWGILNTVIETTEQKKTEQKVRTAHEELHHEQQRLEAHISNSPLAIIEFDSEFRVIRWSKEAEKMFGWKAKEILGKTISNVKWVYKDDEKLVQKETIGLINGKRTRHMNINRNYRKDGKIIWCEWYNSAIYDKRGKLISVFSQVLNITHRKLIEENLRESEQKFFIMFHKAAFGACLIKFPEGLLLDANEAFEKMLGYKKEEIVGKTSRELNLNAYPKSRKQIADDLEKQGYIHNSEIELRTKTGELRTFINNVNIVTIDRKKYLLVTIQDITDRKRLEQQKDEFIGMASHELKTPLTSIKAFAQLLEKRLERNDDHKNKYFLQIISKQLDNVNTLISDLLDVSKISAGKLNFNMNEFSLEELINTTIVDFQYTSDSHQIIKYGGINRSVFGDHDRIQQVLVNLITNAIKYSPDANKIIINLSSDYKEAKISVTDFGFGVPRQNRKKIFDRFFRGSAKYGKNISGFGMGLYISKEIVERHGGKIWVENSSKDKTTFSFTLPTGD